MRSPSRKLLMRRPFVFAGPQPKHFRRGRRCLEAPGSWPATIAPGSVRRPRNHGLHSALVPRSRCPSTRATAADRGLSYPRRAWARSTLHERRSFRGAGFESVSDRRGDRRGPARRGCIPPGCWPVTTLLVARGRRFRHLVRGPGELRLSGVARAGGLPALVDPLPVPPVRRAASHGPPHRRGGAWRPGEAGRGRPGLAADPRLHRGRNRLPPFLRLPFSRSRRVAEPRRVEPLGLLRLLGCRELVPRRGFPGARGPVPQPGAARVISVVDPLSLCVRARIELLQFRELASGSPDRELARPPLHACPHPGLGARGGVEGNRNVGRDRFCGDRELDPGRSAPDHRHSRSPDGAP